MNPWNTESGEYMTNHFHKTGEDRQLLTLYMTGRFGSLRPADLEVYHGLEDPGSIKQFERTFRQLVGKKLVKGKPNALGTTSYVLTHPGIQLLRERGLYEAAKSGKDISPTGATFFHRTLSTLAMIVLSQEHYLAHEELPKMFTEYEMQRKLAPVGASGKLLQYKDPDRDPYPDDGEDHWLKFAPDGLIEVQNHVYRWIEVEASYRAIHRLREKLTWLAGSYDDWMGELCTDDKKSALGQLEDVIWVIPVGEGWYDHETRLRRELNKLEVVTHPHRWTFLRLYLTRRLRLLDYSIETLERHKPDNEEVTSHE